MPAGWHRRAEGHSNRVVTRHLDELPQRGNKHWISLTIFNFWNCAKFLQLLQPVSKKLTVFTHLYTFCETLQGSEPISHADVAVGDDSPEADEAEDLNASPLCHDEKAIESVGNRPPWTKWLLHPMPPGRRFMSHFATHAFEYAGFDITAKN